MGQLVAHILGGIHSLLMKAREKEMWTMDHGLIPFPRGWAGNIANKKVKGRLLYFVQWAVLCFSQPATQLDCPINVDIYFIALCNQRRLLMCNT